MPCLVRFPASGHVCNGCPVTSTSTAMPCLARLQAHALLCSQRLPGDKHKSCHAMPCLARLQAHAVTCSRRLPGDKHNSCHGMASPALSIFFYAYLSRSISRGLCILCLFIMPCHFFSRTCWQTRNTSTFVHALVVFSRLFCPNLFQSREKGK